MQKYLGMFPCRRRRHFLICNHGLYSLAISYVETIPLHQHIFQLPSAGWLWGKGSSMSDRIRVGDQKEPDFTYCAFLSNKFLGPFSTITSSPLLLLWDLCMHCMPKHCIRPHQLSHTPDRGCENLKKRKLLVLICNSFLKRDIQNPTIT
jgi:hypothetical protein